MLSQIMLIPAFGDNRVAPSLPTAFAGNSSPLAPFTYNDETDDWNAFQFIDNGTLILASPYVVDILLVGGGGAGGSSQSIDTDYGGGGGGGAGEVRTFENVNLPAGAYNITIGQGGGVNDFQGGATSLHTYSAGGGGRGGWAGDQDQPPQDGFGGGGGSGGDLTEAYYGANSISSGYSGGRGSWSGSAGDFLAGGGGGGAAGLGSDAVPVYFDPGIGMELELVGNSGGPGGTGFSSYWTGEELLLAGGGGGGKKTQINGSIGEGNNGGGNGAAGNANGVSGTPNTGGGGGGCGRYGTFGGVGGSGTVIVRFRV